MKVSSGIQLAISYFITFESPDCKDLNIMAVLTFEVWNCKVLNISELVAPVGVVIMCMSNGKRQLLVTDFWKVLCAFQCQARLFDPEVEGITSQKTWFSRNATLRTPSISLLVPRNIFDSDNKNFGVYLAWCKMVIWSCIMIMYGPSKCAVVVYVTVLSQNCLERLGKIA